MVSSMGFSPLSSFFSFSIKPSPFTSSSVFLPVFRSVVLNSSSDKDKILIPSTNPTIATIPAAIHTVRIPPIKLKSRYDHHLFFAPR
jgi:hypothetical protein